MCLDNKPPSGWEEPSPPTQRRNIPNYDDGTSLWAPSVSIFTFISVCYHKLSWNEIQMRERERKERMKI